MQKHTTCKSEFYAAIECRTVVGHKSPKSTGQDVECTLNDGLVCIGQCFDYEIRVFCDCGDVTSPVTSRKPLVPTIRPVTSSLIPGNITTTKPLPTKDDCPVGYVWNECATPCRRACKYYGYLLMQSGKCSASSSDCVPGCSPIGSILKCDTSKLWRDSKTCVDVNDCTCVGPNNEQLKVSLIIQI